MSGKSIIRPPPTDNKLYPIRLYPIKLQPQYKVPSHIAPHITGPNQSYRPTIKTIFDPIKGKGQIRCSRCEGLGIVRQEGTRTCSGCAGTGRNMKEDLYMGWCTKCKGSKIETYRAELHCVHCNGSGSVYQ